MLYNLTYRGGTPWTEAHDPDGNIAALDAAMTIAATTEARVTVLEALPVFVTANTADTMSREENNGGLASAILIANALRVTMNAHAANAGEHTPGADAINFPVPLPVATTLPTLLSLSGLLLTAYAAHNADAMLVGGWAFHVAQVDNHALASAVTPVTLQEAVTRLTDLLAKYGAHQTSGVSHAVGNQNPEIVAAPAYGDTNMVPIVGVLGTDSIWIDLVDGGVGGVTLTAAVLGAGFVNIQFSADPQNTAIVRYAIFRT